MGLGSQLLKHVIQQVGETNSGADNGKSLNNGDVLHKRLWCDARLEAAKFYEKFGMVKEGEVFYKEEVPYSVYALYL